MNEHPDYYKTTNLQFGCQRCGDCCQREGYIFFTAQDIASVATYLGWSEEQVCKTLGFINRWEKILQITEDSQCPFYISGECAINPVKPVQCRTYPFWTEIVVSRRSWRREKQDCPGIGKGQCYSPEDVQKYLDMMES